VMKGLYLHFVGKPVISIYFVFIYLHLVNEVLAASHSEMPRRKVRRAESKRQPKAPNGDEGVDLARDIKAEKLRTLMADFDTHSRFCLICFTS